MITGRPFFVKSAPIPSLKVQRSFSLRPPVIPVSPVKPPNKAKKTKKSKKVEQAPQMKLKGISLLPPTVDVTYWEIPEDSVPVDVPAAVTDNE